MCDECRVLVQFFDQDGSGFITCEEMVDQFAELGGLLSAEEIHKFHSVLDRDGNGVIDVSCHDFEPEFQSTSQHVAPFNCACVTELDCVRGTGSRQANVLFCMEAGFQH